MEKAQNKTLIMNKEDYSIEIQKLFSLGQPDDDWQKWNNYLDLQISSAHADELLKIVANAQNFFNYEGEEEDNIYFVPFYAWRILAQLGEPRVLKVFWESVIKDYDNDLMIDDSHLLMKSLGTKGIPEIETLISYYRDQPEADPDNEVLSRLYNGLKEIALDHPEVKEECLQILGKQLQAYKKQDPHMNTELINALVLLDAKDQIELIREAFSEVGEDGSPVYVDEHFFGGLAETELKLGLRKKDKEYEKLANERVERFRKKYFALHEVSEALKEISQQQTEYISLQAKKQQKRKKNKLQKTARKKNRKK